MHSRLSGRIRERRPEQNGLQLSAEDGKRRRVPNMLRQSVPCLCGRIGSEVLTCITARDFTNGLSKVVRCGASEAAVSQHTQPEPDLLWNLEPVQFTEQWGRVVELPC